MSKAMRAFGSSVLMTLVLLAVSMYLIPFIAQAAEVDSGAASESQIVKQQSDEVGKIADKGGSTAAVESDKNASEEKKQSDSSQFTQTRASSMQETSDAPVSTLEKQTKEAAKVSATEPDATTIRAASDSVSWKLSGETMIISGSGVIEHFDGTYYTKRNSITSLVIGEGITGIADKVFAVCSMISSISLPSTLRSIGAQNFMNCRPLTSIDFPSGLVELGEGNFRNCNKLTAVTIPASLKNNAHAFSYSMITSVTFKDGFTTIGEGMFHGCEKLSSVVFPDSLTTIGAEAFYGCEALNQELTFGSNVKTIGEFAFYNCPNIKGVSFKDGLQTIGETAFACGFPGPTSAFFTELTIPKTVTSIGDYAFQDQKYLKSVTILGCKSMGKKVFDGCAALERVILGGSGSTVNVGTYAFAELPNLSSISVREGVASIGEDAFYKCAVLASLSFPKSCVSVGESAFRGCGSLKTVSLGGVKIIRDHAFEDCDSLASLSLNSVLSEMGSYAFRGDSSLRSVKLPKSLVKMGSDVFSSCGKLTSVEFLGSAPSGATSIVSSNTAIIYPENNKTWTKKARLEIAYERNNMYVRNANGSLAKAPYVSLYPSIKVPFGSSAFDFSISDNLLEGSRSFDFTVPRKGRVQISMSYTLPCYHGCYFVVIIDFTGRTLRREITLRTSSELRESKTITDVRDLPAGEYHVEVLYSQTHKGQSGSFSVDARYFTGLTTSSGKKFYYNSNGQKATGLKTIGGKKYYFNKSTGAASKGWQTIGGKKYYFSTNSYAALTGWQKLSGKHYYFNGSGVMQKSKWIGQYYVKSTGERDEGLTSGTWKKSSGKWWYQYKNGTIPKNCVRVISGKTYRFDASGWMRTGWIKSSGSWYYHDGSGAMKTGWLNSGGSKYYLTPSTGKMKTGFFDVGKNRYYSSVSGVIQTGWKKVKGKWYYFNSSGVMQKNKWIGSYEFYVQSDGSMATNKWILNNGYYVDKNGKWDPAKPNPYKSETYSSNKAVRKAMEAISLDFWYLTKESTTGSSGFKAIDLSWKRCLFLSFGEWELTLGSKVTKGSVKYEKTSGKTYHYTFYSATKKKWTVTLDSAKTITMTEVANPKHILVLKLR